MTQENDPFSVLIVDDEPEARQQLRAAVEDMGYSVAEVAEEQSALALLRVTTMRFVVLLNAFLLKGLDEIVDDGLLLHIAADEDADPPQHAYVLILPQDRDISVRLWQLLLMLDDLPLVRVPREIDKLPAILASISRSLGHSPNLT